MRRAPSKFGDAIVFVQSRKIQVGFFLQRKLLEYSIARVYKVPPLQGLYGLIDRCGVCLDRRVAFFAVPHGAGRPDDVCGDVGFKHKARGRLTFLRSQEWWAAMGSRDLTDGGYAIERASCLIIVQPCPTEPRSRDG
jgi:hypothetical protein